MAWCCRLQATSQALAVVTAAPLDGSEYSSPSPNVPTRWGFNEIEKKQYCQRLIFTDHKHLKLMSIIGYPNDLLWPTCVKLKFKFYNFFWVKYQPLSYLICDKVFWTSFARTDTDMWSPLAAISRYLLFYWNTIKCFSASSKICITLQFLLSVKMSVSCCNQVANYKTHNGMLSSDTATYSPVVCSN